MKLSLFLTIIMSSAFAASAKDYVLHSFKKTQLSNQFWSEGANFGDFNKDGKMDIVSGPYWWAGPDFQKRHEYAQFKGGSPQRAKHPTKRSWTTARKWRFPASKERSANNSYADNFFAFTYDLNQDGWTDILILGFPGEDLLGTKIPRARTAIGRGTKRST